MTLVPRENSASVLAQNVSLQFAGLPTFEQIVQHSLERTLRQVYPWAAIDLSRTRWVTPRTTSREGKIQPFMPLVLNYLANGIAVDFVTRSDGQDAYLSETMPYSIPLGVNMRTIEKLILELPWTVQIEWEDALTRYWNADVAEGQTDTHYDASRWGWLSEVLRNTLHVRGLQQPGLDAQARSALDQITRWPDSEQRIRVDGQAPVHAYSLKSTFTRGTSSTVVCGVEILLVRATKRGELLLLCSPGSAVQSFESLEAFHDYWSRFIASRYVVDTVTCSRIEIDGNVFDTQVAMILEQQLTDLKSIELPSRIGLQALSRLYGELSDPARFLLDVPHATPDISRRLEPLLPGWLKKASIVEKTMFQRYSLALASAKKRSQGRTFISDIKDINTFTSEALLKRMQQTNESSANKAQPGQYNPDDVLLTFHIPAGYPGTIGVIDEKKMRLTGLAINNLQGRPNGHLTLSHLRGLTLPTWLTPDYITRKGGLIEQVDIGTSYPRYLQQELLDDSPRVRERQRMFAEQIPPQLLLEALQQTLEHTNGMTHQGLLLLEALFQPDAKGREIDGRPVVIRHLAFLREPEASPDIVTNMFMIEPQDVTTGPHLLYRPFYTPSLQEFPTHQALLSAITLDTDLQNSILTWMSDAARPVYANGGFLEPHFTRTVLLDDFSLPGRAVPPTLAAGGINDDLLQFLHNGQLMQSLYGSNARAVIDQADRDSVSNSESRWAILLDGASLLFNALLVPILRGPLMVTAWIWNLVAALKQDIPALDSEDPVTRELATADLLLNIGMVALQLPSLHTTLHAPLPGQLKRQAMRTSVPRVVAERWPLPAPPSMVEGPVYLPGEYPSADMTLDFSFSSVRGRLTPDQYARLLRMQVPPPRSMPAPFKHGPYTGLYLIDRKWHARVDGRLYQVETWSDSVQIIDPLNPTQSGPRLISDNQGNWSVDTGLRLRGGMPPKRVAEQRRINDQRRAELEQETENFLTKNTEWGKALGIIVVMFQKFRITPPPETQSAPIRKRCYELLKEQTDATVNILGSAAERAKLNIPIPTDTFLKLTEKVIDNCRLAVAVTRSDIEALNTTDLSFELMTPENVEVVIPDRQEFWKNSETMVELTDRIIQWQELEHDQLNNLLDQGAKGEQMFERLNFFAGATAKGTSLSYKSVQVTFLAMLASRFNIEGSERLRHISHSLMSQAQTHSLLWGYDFPERLEVLQSLSEEYGRGLDALQIVKNLHADELDTAYFDRLITLVDGLYQEANQELAMELKPEPKPRKRPPKRAGTSVGRPQKKVIRTRHNGVLVGDLKPSGTSLPIEVVEIRSETDNRLLDTYSRHEDAWDVVEKVRSAPLPKTRPVGEIRAAARKLLGQVEQLLNQSKRYKTQCRYPQEIEEIMNNEADRFRTLAGELDKAVKASKTPPAPQDLALIEQLEGAVTRLANQGSYLRTELSLKLPPTDGNLRYLFAKELIQVDMIGHRKAMSGPRKDVIQEYAINDRAGFPLWYAHFHYESADTPKSDYTAAHLKTKEQRSESYFSLLEKADSPYSVVNVHRGQIGKPLAQRWFLPLAP